MSRIAAAGPHDEFAGLAAFDRLVAVADDPVFHAGARTADAAPARRIVVAGRRRCRPPAGFRHGPGLDDGDPVSPLELDLVLRVDPGPERILDPVIAVMGRFGQAQQDRRNDAEAVHDGGAGIADASPPASGMETIEGNDGAADHDHAKRRAAKRVHVEHGQRRQGNFAVTLGLGDAALRDVPVRQRHEIGVGQDATLGLAGAARGEQQGAFVVGVAELPRG